MIKIDNLGFRYGRHEVLSHISTTFEAGRIYGLLGENGVGKTTLLTLLAGLKKPCEGSIDTDGFEPYNRNPEFLGSLYYLPDEVSPTEWKPSYWASVCGRFYPKFSMELFETVMKEFENPLDHKMNRMSSGQLKKCYISFAIACGASYILMDEPTNGLDIPSKAQFRSVLMKYTGEESTIVISTHQVRDLENVIDPIIILDRCDVILNASVEQITSKLTFDYGSELKPEALYCEQMPGGFVQVYANADGAESKMNVEALFNAAHKNKETIKALFEK